MTIPGFPPFVPADPATYVVDETAGERPVEGYEFFSEGVYYRYTSAPVATVFNGDTFDPIGVIRQGIEQGTDFAGETLDVQLGEHELVVDAFRGAPYGVPFYLRVYREHPSSPSDTTVAIWEGEVTDLKVAEGIATFTVQTARQSVNRTIPRYTHQSICNHQLYGSLCKAVRATYEVSDVVTDMGMAQFMWIAAPAVGAEAAGYWKGGVVTWVNAAGKIRKRFIMDDDVATNKVYLLSPMPSDFTVGETVELVPGCDRKYATCRDKFANTENFGGFPWSKIRDPHKGVL